jgi:hypothetical protein
MAELRKVCRAVRSIMIGREQDRDRTSMTKVSPDM